MASEHSAEGTTMTIAERAVGGVVVLELDGELSFGDTAACLREHLDSLLARDETRIILNLGRLSTMDSSGLGEILRGQCMFHSNRTETSVWWVSRRTCTGRWR